ncbi:ankyrin repeat-containing protein [Cotonvirus japonicus]|uniref:Ankyrin repeat-containing protein n=1 Tax=Cotonvirus japonicus TaxID=2811091 RepID=A0ABM7NR00_9VIRU|nr:ankyrin repeat-containing protein [Cotonvirus japonicus]BCS82581.1 ankyrin repeat-containing protein [Cotonvirus japonicus]
MIAIVIFVLLFNTIIADKEMNDYHCGNCDENANCMVGLSEDLRSYNPKESLQNMIDFYYKCECRPGYSGDGYLCLANECQFDYECPSNYFHGKCIDGMCACREEDGFVWNPSFDNLIDKDVCQCDSNSILSWVDGKAVCIPNGQCVEKYHCAHLYEFEKSHCQQISSHQKYGQCLCNYGYEQHKKECHCPPHKREVWDTSVGQYVCLDSSQCLNKYDCINNRSYNELIECQFKSKLFDSCDCDNGFYFDSEIQECIHTEDKTITYPCLSNLYLDSLGTCGCENGFIFDPKTQKCICDEGIIILSYNKTKFCVKENNNFL